MIATIALVRAEQKLLTAESIDQLEALWFEHCANFADESEERQHLLGIYHDMAARFAVEAFKYVRAG